MTRRKKILLVISLLLAGLFALYAPRLYTFIVFVDPCYDRGYYWEKGQCITDEVCSAAGGSYETGKCVVPSSAK